MLASLRRFDRNTREGILADLALRLLPPPQGATPFARVTSDDVYAEVLDEIRKRVRIQPQDTSQDGLAKIVTVVSEELRSLALPSDKRAEVRGRLGEKGLLPVDQYKVSFDDTFAHWSPGVDKADARKIAAAPDQVEHLLPEKFGGIGEPRRVSLLAKSLSTRVRDPHVLLFLATRTKDKLTITGGWYVFLSDVTASEAPVTPLALFRAFVNKYGVDLRVRGEPAPKLILYDVVRVEPGMGTDVVAAAVPVRPHVEIMQQFMLRYRPTEAEIDIAIAFALNLTDYTRDLERHGIAPRRRG